MAHLKPGDVAPAFEATDQDGEKCRLADLRGKKVFVYFFPKANTSGWTLQTQSVRDALPELKSRGIAVYGISPDNPEVQKKFHQKLGAGFPMLCDMDHRIASAYGVWGEKQIAGQKMEGIVRSSFLIDEEGRVEQAWYKISPQDTIPELMKVFS